MESYKWYLVSSNQIRSDVVPDGRSHSVSVRYYLPPILREVKPGEAIMAPDLHYQLLRDTPLRELYLQESGE